MKARKRRFVIVIAIAIVLVLELVLVLVARESLLMVRISRATPWIGKLAGWDRDRGGGLGIYSPRPPTMMIPRTTPSYRYVNYWMSLVVRLS